MPSTFPMLIEFCVVSSTMLMIVWENCGIGLDPEKDEHKNFVGLKKVSSSTASIGDQETTKRISSSSSVRFSVGDDDSGVSAGSRSDGDDRSLDSDLTMSDSATNNVFEISRPSQSSNFLGSVLGWLLLCGTLALTVSTTYSLYQDEWDEVFELIPYGVSIVLSLCNIAAGCCTFSRLTKLTFYDEELHASAVNQKGLGFLQCQHQCNVKHKMDRRLSTMTLLSLSALKIFSFIAALETSSYVVLVDAVVSMVFAVLQNLFLSYAENKRVKTFDQLKDKPGLSGLEFIRITNFALWIDNTFLLKHPAIKASMNDAFGYMEWAVLSNIFQPLTILYYFHAMITVAEVIHHVYSPKFVGVIRQSKQKKSVTQLVNNDNVAYDVEF